MSKVAFLELSGSLEHVRNRDDRAERYYTLALQLLRQTEDSASLLAASIESNLGFLRVESQRYESAEPFFRQAISEIETAAGPEHPLLVRILVNSAICENTLGHTKEAEVLARRAIELSGRILRRGAPDNRESHAGTREHVAHTAAQRKGAEAGKACPSHAATHLRKQPGSLHSSTTPVPDRGRVGQCSECPQARPPGSAQTRRAKLRPGSAQSGPCLFGRRSIRGRS
jgi:tetratricopeptide (TPR) repeat protein